MAQATVTVTAKIDVNPNGVSISFEGIDSDLASLMSKGTPYVCTEPVYRSYDTSDIVIKTRKALQFVEPVEIESTILEKANEEEAVASPVIETRLR